MVVRLLVKKEAIYFPSEAIKPPTTLPSNNSTHPLALIRLFNHLILPERICLYPTSTLCYHYLIINNLS